MIDLLLLGAIQGIFEWIPISSEGVVALSSQVLSSGLNPVDLALFLHLGTVLAALIYFRKDWLGLARRKEPGLFRFLAVTTVVSLVVGLPVYMLIRDVAVGAALLALMGFGLLGTAWVQASKKKLGLGKDSAKLALIAGVLQGLAVIPGLSRSGSTIFGLSLGDLKHGELLRVSYMMSVPVVIISSIFLTLSTPVLAEAWPALIVSFIVGLVSLSAIMKIAGRINFTWFAAAFAVMCFMGAGLWFLVG